LGLALLLGVFPAGVQAKPVASMPSSGATQTTARQARQAQVARLLSEAKVAKALEDAGLSAEEVKSRLDSLSDEQLEQLAQNLETVQAGKGTAIVLALVAIVLIGMLIYMQIEAS
jgi:hypothetical protein